MEFNPWGNAPLSDDELASLLRSWSEGLAGADADDPLRVAILHEISDLSWTAGTRIGEMIPVLSGWPYSQDKEIEDAICYALHNLAPMSIPILLTMLTSEYEFHRRRAAYALGLIREKVDEKRLQVTDSLAARLDDHSEIVRQESARALGLIGDSRKSTIDRLLVMARNDTSPNRGAALHAIGNIARKQFDDDNASGTILSDEVVKAVLSALGDNDDDIRYSACHALEAIDLPVETRLSHIFYILGSDPSGNVRSRAADQLPKIAERYEISSEVERLSRHLDDEDSIVMSICETIGIIGARATLAIPALRRHIDSESDHVALKAIQALWRVERRADVLLPTLERLFANNGELVCDIICEFGPAGKALLPKLIAALAEDEDWDLQWAAADAIGAIASTDQTTLHSLKIALLHDSPIVRSAAANALGKVGGSAVPILIEILADNEDESKAQEHVIHALATIGSPAIDAAPLLRNKLHSEGAGLRHSAAIALAKIASDASGLPELLNMLDDEDQADNWTLACEALAAIGPAASAASRRLQTLASIPVEELQSAAITAIESINRQPS